MHRRYDLIHYIYSTFEYSTRTGLPLMRPMWMEFPEQAAFMDVDTQFMLGGAFLVAPKITAPDELLASVHRQRVKYLLPEGAYWYNYISKAKDTATGEWQESVLADLDQATFIKGGSIIPILLHEDCLALLKCFENPIRLEVYLDEDDSAEGWLYADDGTSFDYKDDDGSAKI